nr:helix-turn-helix transcriptional regulator [uncultured Brevundimonas sp.]
MGDPSNDFSQVGGRIRAARESSGLNLHQLARLSGISAPALSQIETGKRDLRVSSLLRIASALRIQAGEFLGSPPPSVSGAAECGVGEGYDLEEYQ